MILFGQVEAMGSPRMVESASLIPVLELAPWDFMTGERAAPAESGSQSPENWLRFWQDSLADSGIVGLDPVCADSWHVPTKAFTDVRMLERMLRRAVENRGGIESLSGPERAFALNGGLALAGAREVLLTPNCCSDLGNVADWKQAARRRDPGWEMLWIGHPWALVRYEPPWLLLSEPHESHDPVERWAVSPDDLDRAVCLAVDELKRFAWQFASVLGVLGYHGDPNPVARKLCGLCE